MRNVVIVIFGSRGDHEPLFALATAMANSDSFTNIHICVQPDYAHLVPEHPNIISHALPFQMKDVFSTYFFESFKANLFSWFTGTTEQQRQDSIRAKIVANFVAPTAPTLLRIAEDANPSLLIATSLTAVTALCAARVLRVPMVLVNLQPNTPTPDYPYHMRDAETAVSASVAIAKHLDTGAESAPSDAACAAATLATYRPRTEQHLPSLPVLRPFCTAHGVSEVTEADIDALLRGELRAAHVLNAYPRQLVPRSTCWPRSVLQAPSLAAGYAPPGWVAAARCPLLAAFLAAGPPPLCIAFGSMPVRDTRGRSRALLAACRSAGVARVLIIPGAASLGPRHLGWGDTELREWAEGAVYVAEESTQYRWLLPQCRALVCHGGAGTVGAAMYAGIPLVVAPLGVDQFFWADLVERVGVGAFAGPGLLDADKDAFERALRTVLRWDVKERAAEFGRRIREEGDGATLAAEILSKIG